MSDSLMNDARLNRKIMLKPRTLALLLTVLVAITLLGTHVHRRTLTIDPISEQRGMLLLTRTKEAVSIEPFTSDGCSGNISSAWNTSIKGLSRLFTDIDARYFDTKRIPFEDLCIAHDRAYHVGEGGYAGRLRADNALRDGILTYALEDLENIKRRTGLSSDETALYLYERIADLVYFGVRLGGAPCSGKPYAWGYGYGGGTCIE